LKVCDVINYAEKRIDIYVLHNIDNII